MFEKDFLPEEEQGISLALNGNIRVKIYAEKQFITDSSYHNFCNQLWMEVDLPGVSGEDLQALESGETPPPLFEKLSGLFKKVHTAIVNFFRNEKQQHWVSYIRTHEFYDQSIPCYRLTPAGRWDPIKLYIPKQPRDPLVEVGVTREDWSRFAPFFSDRQAESPAWKVLLANALQHLGEGNGGIAVLESITALEGAANLLAPSFATSGPTLQRLQRMLPDYDMSLAEEGIQTKEDIMASGRTSLGLARSREIVLGICSLTDEMERHAQS